MRANFAAWQGLFVMEPFSGVCGFPCELVAIVVDVPSGSAFVVSSPTWLPFEEANPAIVPLDRRLLKFAFESIVDRETSVVEEVEDSMLTTPEDLDTTILWLRKEADSCSSKLDTYLIVFYTAMSTLMHSTFPARSRTKTAGCLN